MEHLAQNACTVPLMPEIPQSLDLRARFGPGAIALRGRCVSSGSSRGAPHGARDIKRRRLGRSNLYVLKEAQVSPRLTPRPCVARSGRVAAVGGSASHRQLPYPTRLTVTTSATGRPLSSIAGACAARSDRCGIMSWRGLPIAVDGRAESCSDIGTTTTTTTVIRAREGKRDRTRQDAHTRRAPGEPSTTTPSVRAADRGPKSIAKREGATVKGGNQAPR